MEKFTQSELNSLKSLLVMNLYQQKSKCVSPIDNQSISYQETQNLLNKIELCIKQVEKEDRKNTAYLNRLLDMSYNDKGWYVHDGLLCNR